MKVLYVLGNYPKISETYITAEIDYMLRQHVVVQVWSKREGTPGMRAQVPVHRGQFLHALRTFKPDVVHVHYLIVGHAEIMAAGADGVPVTIRGHSYDFTEENARQAASSSYVRRLYLFPHFAAKFPGNKKVVAVPVGYDSTRYSSMVTKNRALVLRTCAAKPTKGIADFLRISALCPAHRFVLLANTVAIDWMPTLRQMVKTIGRVELLEDVPNDEAARWTHEAGIYLDTSDPKGHQFGMPISVAEAMATGSLVLARGSSEAQAYVGGGGWMYYNLTEAATLIQQSELWSADKWEAVRKAAVDRAAMYADHVSLAPILADWRAMCSQSP